MSLNQNISWVSKKSCVPWSVRQLYQWQSILSPPPPYCHVNVHTAFLSFWMTLSFLPEMSVFQPSPASASLFAQPYLHPSSSYNATFSCQVQQIKL